MLLQLWPELCIYYIQQLTINMSIIMFKLLQICLFFIITAITFSSHAGLINLSETLDDADHSVFVTSGGYDWAWASPISVQFIDCVVGGVSDADIANKDNFLTSVFPNDTSSQDQCANQLLAANYRDGWSFYNGSQNGLISDLPSIDKFFNAQYGTYITAFEYWNTGISSVADVGFNPWSLAQRYVNSDWTKPGYIRQVNNNSIGNNTYLLYNTFYVRKSQPVPEPSTILILAIGLLGLSARLRKNV